MLRQNFSPSVFRIVALAVLGTLWSAAIWAQTTATSPTQAVAAPTDKTVEIEPSQKWNDTGIDLHPGDLVKLSATTTGSGNSLCDPQGVMGMANAGKVPVESALPGA